ncbi:MAG: hypothetical protein ACOYOL_09950 [Chthoniobacterales bacterium]
MSAAAHILPAWNWLRLARFRDFEQWDAKRHFQAKQTYCTSVAVLGDHIEEFHKVVRPGKFPDQEFGILGVNNVVGIFDAYKAPGKKIKQSYQVVDDGCLAYNPYRVNVGSIGLKTKCHEHNLISSAYVVFKCRPTLLPEFLYLLFRSQGFNSIIRESTSGSVRQNLTFGLLSGMNVPLPNLEQQAKLVAAHRAAIVQAEAAETLAAECERKATQFLETSLGLQPRAAKTRFTAAKLYFARFASLERWGELFLGTASSSKSGYPIVSGRECLIEVKHGCSASPSAIATGLEVLKISAVTRGALNEQERKHIPDTPEIRNQFSLCSGDVLMCRTNGTLNYVGMSALVEADLPDLVYPDKVIRVRVNQRKLLPRFFWLVAQSSFVRTQIEQAARTTAGNYAIGGKDIWNFQFPLPPLPEQARIVVELDRLRAEARAARAAAAASRTSAAQSFHAALFAK